MQTIRFYKYQGTGNDFIMIDNRTKNFNLSRETIEHLCKRRFGIGADGLILLENHSEYDFKMVYYNSDGRESSMCGNGGRCIAAFSAELGISSEEKLIRFEAIDGYHEAMLTQKLEKGYVVDLKMKDVEEIKLTENTAILNTGSPHYVSLCNNLNTLDILTEARKVRYSDTYIKEGINVNFIDAIENGIEVRTYERGVEDETYSCGTGVVASTIAASFLFPKLNIQSVKTPGGILSVRFKKEGNRFTDIHLTGPAKKVYEGEIFI